MTEARSSLAGMLIAGKYRLIRELSRGGMGQIYLAEHIDLEEPRAIKVIREELVADETTRRRFLREIRATHRVSKQNEHVVAIYDDYGFQDGIGYYVMEFLDGKPLSHFIQESRGTLPIDWAVQVSIDISSAMAEIHQADVIHRDLKPDNIMLLQRPGKPDLVKVFDFGIAKITDSETRNTTLTQLVGTISYMSPEQIAVPMDNIADVGATEIDHRSDIYSLGCILFEMLTGRTPFAPDPAGPPMAPHQLLWAHLHDPPPLARTFRPEVPVELDDVIHYALKKRPDERFQTMQEFANALSQVLRLQGHIQEENIAPRRQPPPSPAPPSRQPPPSPAPPNLPIETIDTAAAERSNGASHQMDRETWDIDIGELQPARPPASYDPYDSTMLLNPWHVRTRVESSPWQTYTIPDSDLAQVTGEPGGRVELSLPDLPDLPPPPKMAEVLPAATAPDLRSVDAVMTLDRNKPAGNIPNEKLSGIPADLDDTNERPSDLPPNPWTLKPFLFVFLVFLGLGGWAGYWLFTNLLLHQEAGTLPPARSLRAENNNSSAPPLAPPPVNPQRMLSNPRCPPNMIYFPQGRFLFGSATNDELRSFTEASLQSRLTQAYCIDQYEYPGKGQTPRGMVTWEEAATLCRRRNKRLCSELEWERACKGESIYRYPYGNRFDPNRCNTRDQDNNNRLVTRSGAFSKCFNSYGLYDMSGNVAEWTSSTFYTGSKRYTVRGGAADRPDWAVRCASRSSAEPQTQKPTLGFRCCVKPLR